MEASSSLLLGILATLGDIDLPEGPSKGCLFSKEEETMCQTPGTEKD